MATTVVYTAKPTTPEPAPYKEERSDIVNTPRKRVDFTMIDVLRTIHNAPRSR